MTKRQVARQERAALVGIIAGRDRRLDAERSLDELAGLAEAAGAAVVLRVLQERPKPDPSTFLGAGKIVTLGASCAETDTDVVVFDHELTPAQLRHIEEAVDRKIIDRTQLILDIFARRARTREGKLQVELAQLKYLLPRLAGSGDALSRLGGGIGTRGPGETKLEIDRQHIRRRIAKLRRGIIQLGLLLLIATPVARVAFSIFGFAEEKDRMYVAFTVIVLLILLYSLIGSASGV